MTQKPVSPPGKLNFLTAALWCLLRQLRRVLLYATSGCLAVIILLIWVNPPTTYYIWQESQRLGAVNYSWTAIADIASDLPRAVVAAEDANFCLHWGFDLSAIRTAIDEGSRRGASTLTQQTVKNVLLWQGRSWTRKAFEALLTPVVEVFWPKWRILELYLNVVEFDTGVFGVTAAAHHYFDVAPDQLSVLQAAQLAAVLPAPKTRSAAKPSAFLRQRAIAIADGAATIRKDGRARCFED